MLLRFEVSNHRSIKEPVELSMIAVDEDRPSARAFERLSERVLSIAGIYGPNASGKSNVLDALAWLSAAVGRSLRTWEEVIPREPFKFDGWLERASTFELDMMVADVRHTYRLEVDDSAVIFEQLQSYPEQRARTLLEREGMELSFRRGLKGLSGTRQLLTSTTLALSAAARFGEPEILNFRKSLEQIGLLGTRHRVPRWREQSAGLGRTMRLFDTPSGEGRQGASDEEAAHLVNRETALTLLRFADLGIEDVEILEERLPDLFADLRGARKRVRLIHRAADQELPFELDEESEGTRTWYHLIGPVLKALRTGQVLLFDEIDASLHPRLSAKLLELFQDPVTNPHGAQLVFTTHDTSLLNHLNRDEVWLTEKAAEGSTTLTALAEFGGDRVRRSLNLERAYLQGRFGAVPELDQQTLRRALGMAAQED
ncbi:ATP-binding protein [Polymorphospora rubra]|uniref:ATPase AAA-type core domain-containing protein n=2 Tax=Polymorphospora rubra TaxID=338584 RepID=A0A810MQJ7_9ACTN|nr:hypothetical protein Prubr_01930 [Polymorphospora rubra]